MSSYRVIEVSTIQNQENLLSPNYYSNRSNSTFGTSSTSGTGAIAASSSSSSSHKSRVDHYEIFRRMSNCPSGTGRNLLPQSAASGGIRGSVSPIHKIKLRPRSKSLLTKRSPKLYNEFYIKSSNPNDHRASHQIDVPIVKTSFRSKSMKDRTSSCHRPSIYVPLVESEQNFLKRAEESSKNNEYRTLVWSSDDPDSKLSKSPNDRDSSPDQMQLYRMRSFKRTSKGIVSQADTIKARSIESLERITGSSPSQSFGLGGGGGNGGAYGNCGGYNYDEFEFDTPLKVCSKVRVTCNYDNFNNQQPVTKLEIQIIGATFVGKTTMASQFMTSEHICSRMDSVNEDSDKFVSVFIDGQEWNIWLHDTENRRLDDSNEVNVELLSGMDGYIVVYSIDDAASFIYAKQILGELVEKASRDSVIVLVANKSDLERSREVAIDSGKQLAKIHRSLFYEVSTVLNHKIDDLLIKTLLKIRHNIKLKEKRFLKHSNAELSPLTNRRVSSLKLSGKSIKNFFIRKFNGRSYDNQYK